MDLCWQRRKPITGPVEFVESGTAKMLLEEVRAELRQLVKAVLERLEDQGIRVSNLGEEWNAINGLDPEEQAFCRAFGQLGGDPFSSTSEVQS